MRRKGLFIFLAMLASVSAWWSIQHISYQTVPPDINAALRAKVDRHYLEHHIADAIKTERFDDVKMYVDLAEMLDINLSSTMREQIQNENSRLKRYWRTLREFGSGFLTGKADSAVGLGGSIASDMTLYGDLRDLKREGTKYHEGKPYDKFILELSLIGVGLSASQLLSVGVSTPLKVGTSVIKAAKRSGTLTKPFTKLISKRLSKSIDTKALKSFNPKVIAKHIDPTPIKGLFREINAIRKETSTADTLALLRYVDDTNDLRKIGKLSKRYKGNTKGVMKVLGKGALRTGKTVFKLTKEFIAGIVGVALSVLGFAVLLIRTFFFGKKKK